jgi:acetyl esterase/lipase
VALVVFFSAQRPASAQQKTDVASAAQPYVNVPETVSKEAQQILQRMTDPALQPSLPTPDDREGWKKAQADYEARIKPFLDAIVKRYEPIITERKLGGVPVLDIKPKGWEDNGKVLVYTHGGAYAFGSAASSVASAAPVADETGLRVISVDYTLAPYARWQQVTGEVSAVLQALQKEGYALKNIALYGDSAGGGLAAGVVLKMRDQGLGMPGAVVLWSPWSDITETGDTYTTLKRAEPLYLYGPHLKPAADAYADPKDQKNPYVSPVYGDYSKGFPPTLIQGGTKEIFLSNFVRQYQALDTAGQTAKLDLYEGMPHVFQLVMFNAPEAQLARRKMKEFLSQYLGK